MTSWPRFFGNAVKVAIVAALATFATTRSAHASELTFSYTLNTGNVLSGAFEGALLSDGNDFDVTSVSSLFVNGVAVASAHSGQSADFVFSGINNPAAVSLDGSYMNLYATSDSGGFAFEVNNQTSTFDLAGASAGEYGGNNLLTAYSSRDWSASLTGGTVPEPSSFALLGTGVLSLAGVARRKFARV